MLHHHMRSSAVQGRAEPPDEDRVSEPPEQARLAREPPQDAFVLDEVRSDELRDDERREAFVPSEKGLTLVAAAVVSRCSPRALADPIARASRHVPTIVPRTRNL
jgi:hypothetical protein